MADMTQSKLPPEVAAGGQFVPVPAKVISERRGAVHSLTLNRPSALNAFDDEMRQIIADAIPAIARNPDIYVVVLKSASPKAFCAGGDVRVLTRTAVTDIERVKAYFRSEYALNWLLDCFSKPTVSLIDGICMGSGAGLSCYNTHRVAGDGYRFSMPEAAIGLFPDVGVSHVLARMPWPLGLYLGLTGRVVERADAHRLGLATHCISSDAFGMIVEQLSDAQPIDPLLDGLHRDQPAGPLQNEAGMIEELFSSDTLEGIMHNLETASGAARHFAQKTLADLKAKSPMSLAITDRHIRMTRHLDLRETLIQDYRLAVRCLEDRDFYEGVRAALIDKDHRPVWSPGALADITETMIERYFRSLGDDDLTLPTRVEMQAARV